GLVAVHLDQAATAPIVFDHRYSLVQVYIQTSLRSLPSIIRPLVERAAAGIATAGHGWRIKDLMVGGLAVLANPAARDAVQQCLARRCQVQRLLHASPLRSQRLVERLCLGERARKAVQERTVRRVLLAKSLEQHGDGQMIRDQFAPIHILAGLTTHHRIAAGSIAEQVARGHLRKAVLRRKGRRLGALAHSPPPQDDDVHGPPLLPRRTARGGRPPHPAPPRTPAAGPATLEREAESPRW